MGKCCRKCYYHYTRIDTNAITINAAMSAGGGEESEAGQKGHCQNAQFAGTGQRADSVSKEMVYNM